MPRVSNAFKIIRIVIKPLNKKNKRNNFIFIMLKRNSINVQWKFGARQKWESAGLINWF